MYVDVVTVLVIGSVTGGAVSTGLAVISFRDRSIPGAVPFGWVMVAATGWCLLNIAWLTATDTAVAKVVFLLTELTSGLIVGLWVVFALVYTGRDKWLTPPRLAGVLVTPSGYALLALTNPIHGLVTADVIRFFDSGQTLFVSQTGIVYTAQIVVSAGFIAIGYVLLGEFLLRSRNLYRKQTFLILTAGLVTAGVHGLFVLGVTPHPGIDATPLTFALNGLLVGFGLFRYDFLSVTPLAGDLLVDELPDPILALDAKGIVIDHNEAAIDLFGDIDVGTDHIDDLAPTLLADIERGDTFTVTDPMDSYDPQRSPIKDQHGGIRGQLLVLREVTGQQRRQNRLEALQGVTRQFIEADRPETIAQLTVRFVTGVLDKDAAGVFFYRDGTLEPTAVSDTVEQSIPDAQLCVHPDETPSHPLWQTYERGQRRVATVEDWDGPFETVLVLPIGDHGVVAIAASDQPTNVETERYAEIMAHTVQVALEQLTHERDLRESRTALKRRNEQIEFFNGVLRHSLRNAMLVVRGRAEHLRESVGEDQLHHVDSITEWCGKLSEMSDTIRDINETVTASEHQQLDVVPLTETVRVAVESATANHSAVTVDLQVDSDERVLANHLAEEVLRSIVGNAIEHNTSDDPHVEITTQHAGDWVQVRVADNGPGISDELKTTVFERTITPNQTAGGFGLYFVSVMMDLYGGKVWYEDNDPRGTIAVLEFQRAKAKHEDETAPGLGSTNATMPKAQGKSPDT